MNFNVEMALESDQNSSCKVKSSESQIPPSGFFVAEENTTNFYKLFPINIK